VLVDKYVTDADGTGIVHQAPAFGEDDHRIALAHGIIAADEAPPSPIDDSGKFTKEAPDFEGQYVKVLIYAKALSVYAVVIDHSWCRSRTRTSRSI
jgi:isoleucyl-tRNA synthetase